MRGEGVKKCLFLFTLRVKKWQNSVHVSIGDYGVILEETADKTGPK